MSVIDLTNVLASTREARQLQLKQARHQKRLHALDNKQLFADEDAEFEDLNNPSLDSPHFADRGY